MKNVDLLLTCLRMAQNISETYRCYCFYAINRETDEEIFYTETSIKRFMGSYGSKIRNIIHNNTCEFVLLNRKMDILLDSNLGLNSSTKQPKILVNFYIK